MPAGTVGNEFEPVILNIIEGIATAAWLGVVVLVLHLLSIVHRAGDGQDLVPLIQAGHAMLQGKSVYSNRLFVYPPTAAVASSPLSLLPWAALRRLWLLVTLVGVVASAVMGARAFCPRWWWVWAPGAAIVALASDMVIHSLVLANVSLVLLPAAVAGLLAFGRDRWVLGSAIVAASALIKPLLAPLLLIPLVRRQWRALLLALAPVATVVLVSLLSVPGASDLPQVMSRVVGGSALTGSKAVWNLSLFGFGVVHHLQAVVLVLRLTILATSAAVGARMSRRPLSMADTVAAGGLVLVTVFLCTNLSEVHYLPLLVLPLVAVVVVTPSRPVGVLLAVAAAVLLLLPSAVLPAGGGPAVDQQWRFLAGELLSFAAFVASLGRPGRTQESAAQPVSAPDARPTAP